MANHDLYEQWLRSRQSVKVPDGFTRRVMAAIQREDRRPSVFRWETWGAALGVQIGLAAAAVVVFTLRFVVLFTVAVG